MVAKYTREFKLNDYYFNKLETEVEALKLNPSAVKTRSVKTENQELARKKREYYFDELCKLQIEDSEMYKEALKYVVAHEDKLVKFKWQLKKG